jgi:hypothetical protein
MFTAAYPANFLPEKNGKGFHVRFPDLPEALRQRNRCPPDA